MPRRRGLQRRALRSPQWINFERILCSQDCRLLSGILAIVTFFWNVVSLGLAHWAAGPPVEGDFTEHCAPLFHYHHDE